MQSSHTLDRVAVSFDDEHAVADAGLILPATLAQHLGLRELFDDHVDLGDAPGHANVGHKAMTLVHSGVLVANDNNYPFSAGRNSGRPDDNVLIVVRAPALRYGGPRP